jgi:hypothetical protein
MTGALADLAAHPWLAGASPDQVRIPASRFLAAMAHLSAGRYISGWDLYEARWEFPGYEGNQLPVPFRRARSMGEIQGQRLLLWPESTLGDTVLALRYVPIVARKAAGLVVAVQPPLKRLAASLDGGAEIVADGDSFEETVLQCPLMSMPHFLRTRVATIPAEIPYLRPPSDCVETWRSRIGRKGGLRIGLAYHGNWFQPTNKDRSVPVQKLAPLFGLAASEFHILHDQITDDDRAFLAGFPNVHLHTEALTDMVETAALMMGLDVVVSVCTAVAHLAGAIGRPVWVVLTTDPYWVWMMDRDDSPWYPTARLFRQTTLGDWDPVIGRIRDGLWHLRPTIEL